jgi:hypothetical protein
VAAWRRERFSLSRWGRQTHAEIGGAGRSAARFTRHPDPLPQGEREHDALAIRHHRVAKSSEGFVFDLADAFAREADLHADFFEGHGVGAVQAVAEL